MKTKPTNVVSLTDVSRKAERSFTKRWKHEALFVKGFVAVPSVFLRYYSKLTPFSLTAGEAMFVLHLMEYKWDSKAPYPSYTTIAKKMGVSAKMVRRHAQSLETKKYLKRVARIGQTNEFDLTPLFDALLLAVEKDSK